ncbi:MAG: thrombospondin type 3 repeat-containing protein, partial [Chloroflexota bacterium]
MLTSLAAVAVAALAIGLLSQPASADSVFAPTTSVRMCNAQAMSFTDPQLQGNPSCADVLTTGTATDTTITVGLPGTNVNFATQVTFMPTNATAGGSIPAGTKLGGIRETATFGITNSTCSNAVMADFILLNVALPNNPGSPLSSTNLAYPQAQGTSDRFSKWKVGSPPGGGDPSGIDPGVDVAHAAGTSVAFQNYPRYLLDTFGNLIPTAAYGALTLAEGEWTPVYLLQFSAGQLATLPGAYSLMNSSMGFPLVWVRGDPTTTVPSPSNITDFCTPVNTTTVLLGRDPSTVFTRATTPAAAGTAMYSQYLASLRDTDQDGFENLIDTCPLAPDVGSPKSGGGDADTDGIDDSCDTAFAPFPSDGDFDGYINRLDNCPQIANTSQAESETATAPDLGTTRDQIGDPCEVG